MGRMLWSLRKLCPGRRAKLRLFGVYIVLLASGLVGRPTHAWRLHLHIGGVERNWWVGDASELGALWEVFLAEQYSDYLPEHADLIVDVGANTGAAAAWFRSRYPRARIVAIEADPNTVTRLHRNLDVDGRVEVIRGALSDADGTVYFDGASLSTLRHIVDSGYSKAIEVRAITLESALSQVAPGEPIDLLKIDTEGGEWRILTQPLGNVRTIVLESHEPTPDGRSPDEVLEEVADREGFQLHHGRWPGMRWLIRNGED